MGLSGPRRISDVQLGLGEGLGPGDHALRSVALRSRGDLVAIHPPHGHARRLRQLQDLGDHAGFVDALGHRQLEHPPAPGPQQLADGLAAFDLLAPGVTLVGA